MAAWFEEQRPCCRGAQSHTPRGFWHRAIFGAGWFDPVGQKEGRGGISIGAKADRYRISGL